MKRALVTGGGSGIGLAIATRLAAHDIEVTIAGRDVGRLERAGLPFVSLDVTDEQAVSTAVADLQPIDILIANAGGAETAPVAKTSRALWDRMIAVNLTSVFLCARAAAPPMVERGWGRFIAIASTASVQGYAYTGAYAAAKHGVLGWVRTMAIELAKTGVTANAICPGFTDTPLIDGAVQNIVQATGRSPDDAKTAFTAANPMGRLVAPDEVADAALWLTGEGAASVNGQTIVIDGGETVS